MSRRVVLWVGIIALVLVCIAIAVLVRTNQRTEPPVNPTASPTPIPAVPQRTLLVSVRADTGLIADAVTMGTQTLGSKATGSWLSMQPGLVVSVAPESQVTIADRGPGAPIDTGAIVGNQLGFGYSDVMVLDRLALAALVDAVNGVLVNVQKSIVALDDDGKPVVLVKKGSRRLYGPAAADYVITLNVGESAEARMARYDDVLRQVVVKLPGGVERTRNILASLGSSSRISGSVEDIAEQIVAMRTALLDSTVTAGVPQATPSIDKPQLATPQDEQATDPAPRGRVIYSVDPAKNQPVMVKLFRQSLLVPGKAGALPRVRVFAAGISLDSIVAAQQALEGVDESLVWGGEIESAKKSEVFVAKASLKALGSKTAVALGLPPSSVKVSASETVGVQISVKLAIDSDLASPQPTMSVLASP